LLYQLWGKLGRQADLVDVAAFHPLLLHMIDVASVTRALWNFVLGRDLQNGLSRSIGVEEEGTGNWLALWAGLHDLGKASPGFQGKWEQARISLQDAGFRFPALSVIPPHGFIIAATLEGLLKTLGIDSALSMPLARSLGGHHGVFPRSGDIIEISGKALGKGAWELCRRDLFQMLAKHCGVVNLPVPQNKPDHAFYMTLAGLVSVADWIGSNETYFPYAGNKVRLGDYVQAVPEKVEKALKELGWLGWRPPGVPKSMEELFPFIRSKGIRPLQQATAQMAENLPNAGLVIVEAPMGEGKTEAAMYLADHWAVALGQKGCYFALPTMATSNQMFSKRCRAVTTRGEG
jgi:CRISPR-associated endonuclease/helicase Cas3